jgi:hypothetical protein
MVEEVVEVRFNMEQQVGPQDTWSVYAGSDAEDEDGFLVRGLSPGTSPKPVRRRNRNSTSKGGSGGAGSAVFDGSTVFDGSSGGAGGVGSIGGAGDVGDVGTDGASAPANGPAAAGWLTRELLHRNGGGGDTILPSGLTVCSWDQSVIRTWAWVGAWACFVLVLCSFCARFVLVLCSFVVKLRFVGNGSGSSDCVQRSRT